jgi:ribonuclease HIII
MALDPVTLNQFRLMGVRDSKDIKKEVLLELAEEIIRLKPRYRSRILMPETYNKMQKQFEKEGKNINELLAWAHSASIKDVLDLLSYKRVKLVIDKFDVEKTYERLAGIDRTKVEIIQKSKGESEIPVAAASIIAKRAFEKSVDELNKQYNLNLRRQNPSDINPETLPLVAKSHFKNVKPYLQSV